VGGKKLCGIRWLSRRKVRTGALSPPRLWYCKEEKNVHAEVVKRVWYTGCVLAETWI
jgi:hypothetical protein